jgi:hypothetical protein
VTAAPGDWRKAQELARLQETRSALGEPESTLRRSIEAAPGEVVRWHALAAVYNRSGQFERAVETLERADFSKENRGLREHDGGTILPLSKCSSPRQRSAFLYGHH